MAEDLTPFGTRLRPSVRRRARLAAELAGLAMYQLIDRILDEHIPSAPELARQLGPGPDREDH